MAIFLYLFLALTIQLSQAAPPDRISGGSATVITNYPWVVELRRQGQHWCGGVFISKRHVLTAAHCLVNTDRFTGVNTQLPKSEFTILAGSTYSSDVKHLYHVVKVDVHPNYNGLPPYNSHDIAVITLDKNIVEDTTQRIIKLPTTYTQAGQFGHVVGWGSEAEDGAASPVLKHAPMWTISNAECNNALPYPVVDTQLCARYTSGHGFCDGDSGGPLIVGDYVVGAVSMSYGCGTGVPDIYTRVHSYVSWIQQKMSY